MIELDDDGEECRPIAVMRANPDDRETYEADLDWFYSEYDSACGLRSVGLTGVEAAFDSEGNRHKWSSGETETVKVKSGSHGSPTSDPWADPRHLATFARGRKVWARLGRVDAGSRSVISSFYTPRYPRETNQNWGTLAPSRKAIVEAIRSYRAVNGIVNEVES